MPQNKEMIQYRNLNVTTIITILNWNRFPWYGDQNGDQTETKTETNKNVKNDKKTKIPPLMRGVYHHHERN